MARPAAIANALKAVPSGRFGSPNAAGMGRISPAMLESFQNSSYLNAYGPFLPRDPAMFSDGAFAPAPPIIPTPLDQPPPGGLYPDPRLWQYRQAWNLPTPPGTEGLKLASFDQLRSLAQKYSVARACIELRAEEIRGLEWSIGLTTNAAKAYRGDNSTMSELGDRIAKLTRFFNRPDPDFWNFDSFLNALLEEIFVYDAMSIIFRPKFGGVFGMKGRGLLGSELDSLNLISGPTIRPLIDLHGGHPAPPAPAYQQFLYGVPRSDYMTIAMGTDIDEGLLTGAEVNQFNADVMLYAPYWPVRESPYGNPPVERALLPIISGLQKQEYQLDYFTEGSVPSVYISPGDNNISPTQIMELQSALNSIAGDPAYHLKVVVLPPGSKVEPQRPVDLSDGFDLLVQTQVCMAFDVQPIELGILPNIGTGSSTGGGVNASSVRFAAQEARDIKSRKSTKPLLKFICNIFNYVIQDICQEHDLQFQFEGLVDDEDKQAITELGVEQIQNGISSIDEIRERLDLPPWGMPETSEPIVITQQGPVPFSMAPQLLQATIAAQGGSDNSKLPSARRGTGGTKPATGSHPAPLSPPRPSTLTPSHAAAEAQVQRPVRGQTGGSPSRSPVAGSRKRGEARSPTQGRLRNKAVAAELDALKRHLRKGRLISTWEPYNIDNGTLSMIAEDIAKGVLLDVAVDRATTFALAKSEYEWTEKADQWPGWESDLGLVGRYVEQVSQAFQDAEIKSRELRKDAAAGKMFVSAGTLHGLISDQSREIFIQAMTPMWTAAWELGYSSAGKVIGGAQPATNSFAVQNFLDTEGAHWTDQVARTGLGNSNARSEVIARTEVARAMNAGAIQAYRDSGVQYKHLLVSPDNCCDICMEAKSEGDIPLDAIFPGGGLGGPFHPNCRCIPAPAGFIAEPPQAHIGKQQEDKSRLAWLLLRAEDEDGKTRFLLQQRSDGSWGMPGGATHKGEDPWAAAVRETTEEIGDLPSLKIAKTFHHVEDDGQTQVYLWVCDVPYFQPKMNGSTPEETQGAAWFRRKEITDLNLTPKFREDWEKSVRLKNNAVKSLQNMATENGEWIVQEEPRYGAGTGSNWPYPVRANGSPALDGPDGRPVPQNNRPGGGQVTGEMGAIEPPFIQDDMSDRVQGNIYPRGSNDESAGRRRGRNRPAKKLPHGPDEVWPKPGAPQGEPGPGGQGVPGGPVRKGA